jgi:hypothetical protein
MSPLLQTGGRVSQILFSLYVKIHTFLSWGPDRRGSSRVCTYHEKIRNMRLLADCNITDMSVSDCTFLSGESGQVATESAGCHP